MRAIREIWGADSGTNVTKTETFYGDAIAYRYRLRVHPIPPDGLYTSWDYNRGAVAVYYNEINLEGVAIDGRNDDVGNIDALPILGPAFFDAPDPTVSLPVASDTWEQVSGSGDNGSLVYMLELLGPQSAENPTIVPYYRDDSCFDDRTGYDPWPRAYPGESYEWMRSKAEQATRSRNISLDLAPRTSGEAASGKAASGVTGFTSCSSTTRTMRFWPSL